MEVLNIVQMEKKEHRIRGRSKYHGCLAEQVYELLRCFVFLWSDHFPCSCGDGAQSHLPP